MASSKSPKGGRPSKGAGSNAVAVNLRIALEDHAAVAELAKELSLPGRPLLTVQDVIRRLVRGGLSEPETLRRLIDIEPI